MDFCKFWDLLSPLQILLRFSIICCCDRHFAVFGDRFACWSISCLITLQCYMNNRHPDSRPYLDYIKPIVIIGPNISECSWHIISIFSERILSQLQPGSLSYMSNNNKSYQNAKMAAIIVIFSQLSDPDRLYQSSEQNFLYSPLRILSIHDWLSRYHLTVRSNPSSNVTDGFQPNSTDSFVASIA